jgi:tRNA-specific 2-thiouridylase
MVMTFTVAVAMSGGVDSSVAAARCVEARHRVFGMMLRLWSEPGAAAANRCCAPAAVDDAAAVASALDIPFHVIDAEEVFEREVVAPFVTESAAGDTPNPCLRCNRLIRFGFLLDQARALGADVLATGHYARVEEMPDGTRRLLRGVDPGKDQSYVLHVLDQARLAHARFPVGALPKSEVRRLARRYALPVASRADSVDLCWVGDHGVPGFLERHLPPGAAAPGPIETQAGDVVGEHRGLPYYTLGQRRGLGVSLGRPVHVVAYDRARNALIVGDAAALLTRDVHVRGVRWIAGTPPERGSFRAEAQVRYRAPAASCVVTPRDDGTLAVCFDTPQRAPTPGQALVVYRGETCLGGGRIVDAAAAA